MIDGVRIKKLTRHADPRGWLMEILRDDDELFLGFGQVYVSAAFPGVVKAWHCHEIQTDSFCVLAGNAKIGLFDDREGSPTCGEAQAIVAGELNPVVVQIPPLVWHGFMSLEGRTAIVLNVPTEHYNREEPDELRREPFDPTIPFEWITRGG
ncbi:MAG: dTDP-4-dehydrorhamnose 3,5-epimerase [candidate division WS1 bacterium]|jgi:dTDP-4-dehydrorhamnose 3,5-epimerase|nr:dTDP-4-dehydrorhamnose 3,5-epimerase [candidate division WS1 bacterium]